MSAFHFLCRCSCAVLGLALGGQALALDAQRIVRLSDEQDSIYLTNLGSDQPSEVVVAEEPVAHAPAAVVLPAGSLAFDSLVQKSAAQYHLDPALLHAVIAVESNAVARAVSPKGARGLMQLLPATALRYGVTDLFDPAQNISAGARHLRGLLDRFGGDRTLALAAYNAGAEAVLRYGKRIPPFAETKAYVPKVLARYEAGRRASPTREKL